MKSLKISMKILKFFRKFRTLVMTLGSDWFEFLQTGKADWSTRKLAVHCSARESVSEGTRHSGMNNVSPRR